MKRELIKARRDLEKIRSFIFELPFNKEGEFKKGLTKEQINHFDKLQDDFRNIYFHLIDIQKLEDKKQNTNGGGN